MKIFYYERTIMTKYFALLVKENNWLDLFGPTTSWQTTSTQLDYKFRTPFCPGNKFKKCFLSTVKHISGVFDYDPSYYAICLKCVMRRHLNNVMRVSYLLKDM